MTKIENNRATRSHLYKKEFLWGSDVLVEIGNEKDVALHGLEDTALQIQQQHVKTH